MNAGFAWKNRQSIRVKHTNKIADYKYLVCPPNITKHKKSITLNDFNHFGNNSQLNLYCFEDYILSSKDSAGMYHTGSFFCGGFPADFGEI